MIKMLFMSDAIKKLKKNDSLVKNKMNKERRI